MKGVHHQRQLDEWRVNTLVWINAVRQGYGMRVLAEIPCGKPGRASRCPVAEALSGVDSQGRVLRAIVGGVRVAIFERGTEELIGSYPCPVAVDKFIGSFDHGCYPDLEERGVAA